MDGRADGRMVGKIRQENHTWDFTAHLLCVTMYFLDHINDCLSQLALSPPLNVINIPTLLCICISIHIDTKIGSDIYVY